MSQHEFAIPGDLACIDTLHPRQNLRQRDIVNHGISVQLSCNTMSAIEYLKAHDIDALIILRVLLEPHKRRSQPRPAFPGHA